MAVEAGHQFPAQALWLDPTRVEEFVTALGVAPEPGYEPVSGALLPPGFLMYVTTYGADPVHHALEVDPLRIVYGGATVEHHAPIRVGDTLTVEPELSDVTHKEGRAGSLTFYEITCRYRAADGSVVAVEQSTIVER